MIKTGRVKQGSLSRSKRKKLLLLIPIGIMILCLSLYPTLRGIYLGFTNYKVGRPIEFNGFENYIGIYNSGYLLTAFKNIGIMLLISVIAIYIISMMLALLLNSKIPMRGLWRALLIIPWAVPPIAKVAMWKAIFNPVSGYLNAYLGQFTRNYTQTVKRAADNKRRYAPGWVHSTCLLRGFPKGAAPHLAHDFAEQSVVRYTLCRRCPENTVAAGEGKGI